MGLTAASRSPLPRTSPWSMERQVRVTAGALVLTFFGLAAAYVEEVFCRGGVGWVRAWSTPG